MGVELLYSSVMTEVKTVEFESQWAVAASRVSRQLEIGRSYRRDVVRKATSDRRGHLGPDELGSREDADKMQ